MGRETVKPTPEELRRLSRSKKLPVYGCAFRRAVCRGLFTPRRPRGVWHETADGTLMYPRRHNGGGGRVCPGVYLEAEWVKVEGLRL